MSDEPQHDQDQQQPEPEMELAFPDLKLGDAWGESITKQRAGELEARLQTWEQEQDHGGREGPFDPEGLSSAEQATLKLSGADVFWLAARVLAGTDEAEAVAGQMAQLRQVLGETDVRTVFNLSALHLEHADLSGAHLEHAALSEAHLEHADLSEARLKQADLMNAHLERAVFRAAHLEDATLYRANGMGAIFYLAHMHRANLLHGHFQKAGFAGANLTDATFGDADLRQADFANSDLAGAKFMFAKLGGADLRGCSTDASTDLSDARLGDKEYGFACVAGVQWGGANVAAINWSVDESLARVGAVNRHVVLGDETLAWNPPDIGHIRAGLHYDIATVVRSYRQLAALLRGQGANEQADELMYRAQRVQRVVLRRGHRYLSYVGSLLLDLLAGYGYRPLRAFAAYALVIALFTGLYLLNAQFAAPHLTWDESLVLSISSFHGRGFFTTGISLGDTLARLAAGEAIIGLLIEITFIATFTQRFFAR